MPNLTDKAYPFEWVHRPKRFTPIITAHVQLSRVRAETILGTVTPLLAEQFNR